MSNGIIIIIIMCSITNLRKRPVDFGLGSVEVHPAKASDRMESFGDEHVLQSRSKGVGAKCAQAPGPALYLT